MTALDHVFTVIAMDGRRVARLRVAPAGEAAPAVITRYRAPPGPERRAAPTVASTFGMQIPATTVRRAATSTATNTAVPASVAATGSVGGRRTRR